MLFTLIRVNSYHSSTSLFSLAGDPVNHDTAGKSSGIRTEGKNAIGKRRRDTPAVRTIQPKSLHTNRSRPFQLENDFSRTPPQKMRQFSPRSLKLHRSAIEGRSRVDHVGQMEEQKFSTPDDRFSIQRAEGDAHRRFRSADRQNSGFHSELFHAQSGSLRKAGRRVASYHKISHYTHNLRTD